MAIGPDGYGGAEVRLVDGRPEVVSADEVIGISLELLVEAVGHGLYVDDNGWLWLAGDPEYKYRPTRFAVTRNSSGAMVEGARVVVCERVR